MRPSATPATCSPRPGRHRARRADVLLRAHVVQDDDGTPGDLTRADVLFDLYAPGSTGRRPTRPIARRTGRRRRRERGRRGAPDRYVDRRGAHRSGRGRFAAPASDAGPLTVYAPDPGGSSRARDGSRIRATRTTGARSGLAAAHADGRPPSGRCAYAFAGRPATSCTSSGPRPGREAGSRSPATAHDRRHLRGHRPRPPGPRRAGRSATRFRRRRRRRGRRRGRTVRAERLHVRRDGVPPRRDGRPSRCGWEAGGSSYSRRHRLRPSPQAGGGRRPRG